MCHPPRSYAGLTAARDLNYVVTNHETSRTKFYYIIPDNGVGAYENRFLTPMSDGVWWSTLAACVLCVVVLGVAALHETRPKPGPYAFFSVYAAICQQGKSDAHSLRYYASNPMPLLPVMCRRVVLHNSVATYCLFCQIVTQLVHNRQHHYHYILSSSMLG